MATASTSAGTSSGTSSSPGWATTLSGAIGGTAGLFLELDAVAAAIVGGTAVSGGRGRIQTP